MPATGSVWKYNFAFIFFLKKKKENITKNTTKMFSRRISRPSRAVNENQTFFRDGPSG